MNLFGNSQPPSLANAIGQLKTLSSNVNQKVSGIAKSNNIFKEYLFESIKGLADSVNEISVNISNLPDTKELNDKLTISKNVIEQLKKDLAGKQSELDKIRADIQQCSTERTDLTNKQNELNSQVQAGKTSQAKLEEITKQNAELNAKKTELEKKSKELEESLNLNVSSQKLLITDVLAITDGITKLGEDPNIMADTRETKQQLEGTINKMGTQLKQILDKMRGPSSSGFSGNSGSGNLGNSGAVVSGNSGSVVSGNNMYISPPSSTNSSPADSLFSVSPPSSSAASPVSSPYGEVIKNTPNGTFTLGGKKRVPKKTQKRRKRRKTHKGGYVYNKSKSSRKKR